jgi:hypothetical protein
MNENLLYYLQYNKGFSLSEQTKIVYIERALERTWKGSIRIAAIWLEVTSFSRFTNSCINLFAATRINNRTGRAPIYLLVFLLSVSISKKNDCNCPNLVGQIALS